MLGEQGNQACGKRRYVLELLVVRWVLCGEMVADRGAK